MKDLIQQAAEDCYTRHAIGKTGGYYQTIVTHFLSYAKEKHGMELLRVEGDVEEIIENLDTHTIEFYNDEDAAECYDEMCNSDEASDAIRKAYALGAAKERERIKGVFEKFGKVGEWTYDSNRELWEDVDGYIKTTDELINLYQNKER